MRKPGEGLLKDHSTGYVWGGHHEALSYQEAATTQTGWNGRGRNPWGLSLCLSLAGSTFQGPPVDSCGYLLFN